MSNEENRDVSVDRKHLIKILTESLNSDPRTPLREYVANASDACLGRPDPKPDPKIYVWSDRGERSIHISDNGCGMTEAVILKGFTRLGGSEPHGSDVRIGQFGLGVLSAFMIADLLEVHTRSKDEPLGWFLRWKRQAESFTLRRADREEVGTHVRLTVTNDYLELVDDRAIRAYLKRNFGLFTTPILVGDPEKATAPVNNHYRWLRAQAQTPQPRLLAVAEAREIMRQYCSTMDMMALYGTFEHNGVRILLGIPAQEHSPLDLHKTWFFCKGILIQENVKKFFPENLAFLVGLFEHPGFKLQVTREKLLEDESYHALRETVAEHAINFLELLAREQPALLEQVLRLHRSMLLAHSQQEPRLRDLFREHYRFATTNGPRRWSELVTFCSPPEVHTIYLLKASTFKSHVVAVAQERNIVVVEANDIEATLLEDIARSQDYRVVDATTLLKMNGLEPAVPQVFIDLASRLNAALTRHGIPRSTPMHLPKEPAPAILETGVEVRSGAGGEATRLVGVEGLLINTAHPLIERLAASAAALDPKLLQRAADLLFYIAIVNSPFDETRRRVTGEIVATLIYSLELELAMPRTSYTGASQAKCFVALPWRSPFDTVWNAVRLVLGGAPYHWQMARSNDRIEGPELFAEIRRHIATSRRFLADVSSLNSNVLVELGMMLERDLSSTVILCDRETFEQMPAGLQRSGCLVYDGGLRSDPPAMRSWFEREISKNATFCALQGTREATASAHA